MSLRWARVWRGVGLAFSLSHLTAMWSPPAGSAAAITDGVYETGPTELRRDLEEGRKGRGKRMG